MSEQWYCPNCGPEIGVTVERIHTFAGPDDYLVCNSCGETVDEKAETPAFVLALQSTIAEQAERIKDLEQRIDEQEETITEAMAAHWRLGADLHTATARCHQQFKRIATLEAACESSRRYMTIVKHLKNSAITEIARKAVIENLRAAGYPVGEEG